MPDALPVSAVNHVGITTRRVEESTAFYRDVLGFREVSRPNFNFRGAWLYNYGLMIHLFDNEAAGGRTDEIQTRDNHLALHSDDLAGVERLLTELARARFIVRYEHDGRRYIQVRRFAKHQNPHIKEAPSTIPAPGEHSASSGISGTSPADS